jgi:putative acetyltransferase
VFQRRGYILVLHFGDVNLQHEKSNDDGEDSIAECFDPRGRHFTDPKDSGEAYLQTFLVFSQWWLGQCYGGLTKEIQLPSCVGEHPAVRQASPRAADFAFRLTHCVGASCAKEALHIERRRIHDDSMLIRRETPGDVEAIRGIARAAFMHPGRTRILPPEVALIDELRSSDCFLPALSLVAVNSDADVVGYVLCTRGRVDSAPVLALGPLAVLPDQQRGGVGLALMHAILGAAEVLDEPLVGVLGDPGYYSRFGFRPSEEYKITPPVAEWRPYFQVRVLTGYSPLVYGTFTYPEPFHRL